MHNKDNKMVYKIIQIVLSVLSGIFLFLPYLTVKVAYFGGASMVGKDFLTLIFKFNDAMSSYGVFDLMEEDAGSVKFVLYLLIALVLIPIIVSVISIVIAIISDKKFMVIQGIIQTIASVGMLIMSFIMYFDVETAFPGIGVYLQILLGIGMIVGGILLNKSSLDAGKKIKSQSSSGQIRVLGGQYEGATLSLDNALVFGRDSSVAQLVLDNPKASKKHCIVTYDETADRFYVEDFSTNGVYKRNGERIPSRSKVPFKHGEAFVIKNDRGDDVFQFQ